MKMRNVLNTMKNKKYKYIIKLSENTFAVTKDGIIKPDSLFYEYKMFKNEYLDIQMHTIVPLVRKPLI